MGEGDGAMEMGCIEDEIGPIKKKKERIKITEKSDDLAKLSISEGTVKWKPLRFDIFGGGGGAGLSLVFFGS